MQKNDGGAAFPVLHSIDGNWVREPLSEFKGMTLRDYFAAAALQGLCSMEDNSKCPMDRIHEIDIWRAEIAAKDAKWCYLQADAMLAERAK